MRARWAVAICLLLAGCCGKVAPPVEYQWAVVTASGDSLSVIATSSDGDNQTINHHTSAGAIVFRAPRSSIRYIRRDTR